MIPDFEPDWHCIACGASGVRADGPVERECPHLPVVVPDLGGSDD